MTGKHSIQFITIILLLLTFNCISPIENKEETELTSNTSDSIYLAKGQQIAGAVFATLSGKLMKAIQEGGVEQAVSYCNIQAHPLTDSLSEALETTIKRTSHKVRNPANAPDTLEASIIAEFLDKQSKGETLTPRIVMTKDEKRHFFAPILLAKPCLQCHGEVGKEIKTEDYSLIKSLYEEDKAVGFAEGDLRGIWSIMFEE